MSDWEPGARNAFKVVYPEIKMYGCWFHYTQRIWAKAQKLGLSQGFPNDLQTTTYIRQLIAIPFLPEALIYPTATLKYRQYIIPKGRNWRSCKYISKGVG